MTDVPSSCWRRKRKQPQQDTSWHKAYAKTMDRFGRPVRDLTNWRRCTCPIGQHHDEVG